MMGVSQHPATCCPLKMHWELEAHSFIGFHGRCQVICDAGRSRGLQRWYQASVLDARVGVR